MNESRSSGSSGQDERRRDEQQEAGAASERADEVLEDQRAVHEPDSDDVDDIGIGALINNTGFDGDAPTG